MTSTLFVISAIIGFAVAPTLFFFGLLKGLQYLRDDSLLDTLESRDADYNMITWGTIFQELQEADNYTDVILGNTENNESNSETEWKYNP